MRASEASGSQPIRSMASAKCRRMLRKPAVSMAASALAMPLTNGSTPMMPVRGRCQRLRDHVFAAAEADFERDVVNRHREQRAPVGAARRLAQVEREPGQYRLDQFRLPRPQLWPLRRPKKARAASGSRSMAIVGE